MSITDNVPALFGGFIASSATQYLGVTNPIIGILGASVGAVCMNKIHKFYTYYEDMIPNISDKILKRYFKVIINRETEGILFNSMLQYIVKKFKNDIMEINADRNPDIESIYFSNVLVDTFKNKKIYISFLEGKIILKSKELIVDELKKYIHSINCSQSHVITIHQATFSIKENRDKEKSGRWIWNTVNVITNKNFENTIVSSNVQKEFLDDLEYFIGNEEYYNRKGLPYRRGYLLHGPPGTGKTSLIKSIASKYGMSIYLLNLGDIKNCSDITHVFQDIKNDDYHMIILEDFDKVIMLDKYYSSDMIRTLLNEIDGVVETRKRILIFSANDKDKITIHDALCRPGRIDKIVELGYCDKEQICKIYNHFCGRELKIEILRDKEINITPSQLVTYLLSNSNVSPEELIKNFDTIKKIQITGPKMNMKSKRRCRITLSERKKEIKKMERQLITLPKILERKKCTIKRILESKSHN